MAKYCITATKPADADHHLKTQFKLWRYEKQPDDTWKWAPKGWESGGQIAALLEAGHEVLTAKKNSNTISTGAAVELEFRIARNGTKYKISEMPDK